MGILAVLAFPYGMAVCGVALSALVLAGWFLYRRDHRAARWLRQASPAVSLAAWLLFGRQVLARVRRSITRPRLYVPLLMLSAVLVLLAWHAWGGRGISASTDGQGRATSALQTARAADDAGPAPQPAKVRHEPAAWGHYLSQRQRAGCAALGGLLAVVIVVLAVCNRLNR